MGRKRSAAKGKKNSRRRKTSLWRRWFGWLGLALLTCPLGLVCYLLLTWPDVSSLTYHNPASSAFMERDLDVQRRIGRSNPTLAFTWVPYERISDHMKAAVIVAEDINFFTHDGFDRAEIRDAIESAVEERKPPRGASTISQQLAKNLWLSPARNPWRKLKEALLTMQMERSLSKKRILELYLNMAAFGPGIYGVEAAAQRYFGIPAADLTRRQAAQLAAGLPRPSYWHPGSTSKSYQKRVFTILRRMEQAGVLRKHL